MKSSFTNTCLLLFKLFTCNDYVDKIVLQCLSAGATSAAAPSPPSAGLAANSKERNWRGMGCLNGSFIHDDHVCCGLRMNYYCCFYFLFRFRFSFDFWIIKIMMGCGWSIFYPPIKSFYFMTSSTTLLHPWPTVLQVPGTYSVWWFEVWNTINCWMIDTSISLLYIRLLHSFIKISSVWFIIR